MPFNTAKAADSEGVSESGIPPTGERLYTNFPGTKYFLPSDDLESQRLRVQHELLKRECNGQFVPASIKLSDGDVILDSGTGSGLWPIDVLPLIGRGVTIVAIDIESRLFPAAPPTDISFAVHSVLSLPSEWTSTYQLAHQRLLIGAFGLTDWQQALSELYRVLKPGGMILLEEAGSWTIEQAYELPETLPATRRLLFAHQELFRIRDLLPDCASRMPELLRTSGFEDVDAQDRSIRLGPGEVYAQGRDVFLRGVKEIKTGVLRLGGLGLATSDEEWEEFIRELEAEWNTNDFSMSYFVFTARKP